MSHSYADLDELIVNHVQAMARRVEELMLHEKFKPGPEDELREYTLPHFSFHFLIPRQTSSSKILWLLIQQRVCTASH
jgi:hypothetical protein